MFTATLVSRRTYPRLLPHQCHVAHVHELLPHQRHVAHIHELPKSLHQCHVAHIHELLNCDTTVTLCICTFAAALVSRHACPRCPLEANEFGIQKKKKKWVVSHTYIIYIYIDIYMYEYMLVHIHKRVCIYMCVYIYVYIMYVCDTTNLFFFTLKTKLICF